ncbi:serine/threonine protein kinase [bacterium CPR1]|nr:serine/threonine protein kinase [bacterium CPR1]
MHIHEPGTMLDNRYRILELVGKGGMGAVYRARDMRLSEKVVAVKQVLDEEEISREFAEERLKLESQTLEKLRHPGIPQVMDAFREDNSNYIVMEFVEGTSLDKLLDHFMELGGPMPQEMVIDLALKICDVIGYLHAQEPPIIHRDIKPQNILVRENTQEVVLVDFGLARNTSSSGGTKTLVGTLGYAPLEQFKGLPETRSDLYGLGATMHHLISGKAPQPFQIPPLQEEFPRAHPALAAVVDRCCQEKPERRFANIQTVKAALKKALGEMTGIYEDLSLTPAASDALIKPPEGPMPASLFAFMALVLVVGGLAIVLSLAAMKQNPQTRASASPSATPLQATPDPDTAQNPIKLNVPTPRLQPQFRPRTTTDTPVQLQQPPPAVVASASNWFTGRSREAWKLSAASRLDPTGSMMAEPGEAAGAWFERVADAKPRHLSVRVRRLQPCDFQVMMGNLAILSRYDQANNQYGVQLLGTGGGNSDLLLQSEIEGRDGTYELTWTEEGQYTLTVGTQSVRFGGSPLGPVQDMTVLLAPPEQGMVTIEISDIATE